MNTLLALMLLLASSFATAEEPVRTAEPPSVSQLSHGNDNWFSLSARGVLTLKTGSYAAWDFPLDTLACEESAASADACMTRVKDVHVLTGSGVYAEEVIELVAEETRIPEISLQKYPPLRIQAVLEDGLIIDLSNCDDDGWHFGSLPFELRKLMAATEGRIVFTGNLIPSDMITLAAMLKPGVPVMVGR